MSNTVQSVTDAYQAVLNEIQGAPSETLLPSNTVALQNGMSAWNNVINPSDPNYVLPYAPFLFTSVPVYSQSYSLNYISQFLGQFSSNNPLPTDMNTFFDHYVTYLHDQAVAQNAVLNQFGAGFLPSAFDISAQARASIISHLEASFAQDFGVLVNNAPNSVTVTNPPAGNPTLPNDTADLPSSATTSAAQMSAFTAWFNHNLANYSYPTNGGAVTQSNFLSNAVLQFEPATKISSSSSYVVPTGNNTYAVASNNASIPSFQDIYDKINGSDTGFQAAFQQFYTNVVNQTGYFIPSQQVSQWAQHLADLAFGQALKAQGALGIGLSAGIGPSTLAILDSKRLLILDRILILIAEMLSSLQRTAAAQSSRLVIFANWQKAYTDSLGQLHTFTKTDSTMLNDSGHGASNLDQNKANARDELNTKFNDALRNNMQNQRSVLGDDSKALQSNINQSTDAVSQQANLASTILSDLFSLLSSIFR